MFGCFFQYLLKSLLGPLLSSLRLRRRGRETAADPVIVADLADQAAAADPDNPPAFTTPELPGRINRLETCLAELSEGARRLLGKLLAADPADRVTVAAARRETALIWLRCRAIGREGGPLRGSGSGCDVLDTII